MSDQNSDASETLPGRPYVGFATLGLIFVASAVFTGTYLQTTSVPQPAQTAAAVESVPDPFADISLKAKSAYVVDLTNGKVLYRNNADAQLPLASLTKIMLVLAVTDVLKPDTVISIPPHTTPDGGPKRIPDGSTWRAQDLIDFTLVSSSNEGAELLAGAADTQLHAKYSDAPVDRAALWRMNAIAKELGLEHTYFLNVSGLDLSPTQSGAYGSASDVAKIFSYALANDPAPFEGTAKSGLLRESVEGDKATAINTDKALGAIPGLIMGKTGLTDLAGGNLAIAFDAGPAHPIVAVVLGSTDDGRFSDVKNLLEPIEASLQH